MANRLPVNERDLARQLEDLRDRNGALRSDELFALWFLVAFITDNESQALDALCGGARDQGIDALFIDDRVRQVTVVQTKYRQQFGKGREGRSDLLSFAALAGSLSADADEFRSLIKGANAKVAHLAAEARKRLAGGKFSLQLFYVTTGRVSSALVQRASQVAKTGAASASLHILDGRNVLLMLRDYLDGVAPPVPSLELEIESGDGVRVGQPFERFDGRTGIDSWILSVRGNVVGDLYGKAGIRLFARNVRGYLGGVTEINKGMSQTLDDEPEFFWYYNNGVTIICDEVREGRRNGRRVLTLSNPQVINGQQTTRTLYAAGKAAAAASVLVRIIKVPREDGADSAGFEQLVSRIVQTTNWQNAIKASDLVANDRRQIDLERGLRKFGYLYVRKRQTKSEAKRSAGMAHRILVKKDELAQAVAACDLDPVVVREGKEGLFEERLYSTVFGAEDPVYYLTRYWLVRIVGYSARGKPERGYAKWLVANRMWARLSPMLRGNILQEQFRRMGERTESPIGSLDLAVTVMYQAALALFRHDRGTGEAAKDVSSFFKRKGLDVRLERFLKTKHGVAYSRRLSKRIDRFRLELKEAADGVH